MPHPWSGIPRDLTIHTRFHRQAAPPEVDGLDDFEEFFLFRALDSDDAPRDTASTFWLVHEHDQCLWMLNIVPASGEGESVIAWCNAPNDLPKPRMAERLICEWCRASRRNGRDSPIRYVSNTGGMSLDFDRTIAAAVRLGDAPLHEAVAHGDPVFAHHLLGNGAAVDARDHDQRTPLHYAAIWEHAEMARLLVQHGANRQARDNDGALPVDFSRDADHGELVRLLEDDTLRGEPAKPRRTGGKKARVKSKRLVPPEAAAVRSEDVVVQILRRAERWHRRDDELAAEFLWMRAAETPDAPAGLVARALMGLARCHHALGRHATVDKAIEELAGDERHSAESRARMLYRRGRGHMRLGDSEPANGVFERILQLEDPGDEIVAKARIELAGWYDRQGETERALEELGRVLSLADLSQRTRAQALLKQGGIKYTEGHTQAAIDDLSAVITGEAPAAIRAKALVQRSKCYEEQRLPQEVIRDLRDAVELGDYSSGTAGRSLHNYGVRCNLRGEPEKACEYFTAVADFPGTGVWIQTNARVNRGCHVGTIGDFSAAVTDFKLALATPGIPHAVRARAIYNLGNARRMQKIFRAAIREFTRVIEMPNPPDVTLAAAFSKRGRCYTELEKPARGLRDLSRALTIPGAETETICDALLWSGISYLALEDVDKAKEFFTRLIELPTASAEMRARAKWGLGDTLAFAGDKEAARRSLLKAREELEALDCTELVKLLDKKSLSDLSDE